MGEFDLGTSLGSVALAEAPGDLNPASDLHGHQALRTIIHIK